MTDPGGTGPPRRRYLRRVTDILERARTKVLHDGEGLSYDELVEVLQLPDDQIPELLQLAHDVRMT